MAKLLVDINSDLGESFGNYVLGRDEDVLNYVTSANIACGFHAGDYMVMAKTVKNAIKNNVGVGAHPGYPDLQGFGRRSLKMTFEELKNMILYQIGAIEAIIRCHGGKLRHVKLHGALSNDCHSQSEKGDYTIAEALGKAVLEYDKDLIVIGYTKSAMIKKLIDMGLKVVEEVYADRAYNVDCTLVSRNIPGAVITSPDEVIKRVLRMINDRTIITYDNQKITKVNPESICIHGDTPMAVKLARQCREALEKEGILVRTCSIKL
ncbi:MAG: 5-oxoprolinase subunit PxpA [Dehalobacterium sp.]